MAGNEFLDKGGLATLWERIKQLVYECGCQCKVTYTLESDGSTLTLVGSDGSKSVVSIIATASCSGDDEPQGELSLTIDVPPFAAVMRETTLKATVTNGTAADYEGFLAYIVGENLVGAPLNVLIPAGESKDFTYSWFPDSKWANSDVEVGAVLAKSAQDEPDAEASENCYVEGLS